MKLTCDLCGGELQMKAGGQSAACAGCGLEYSRERLMEMLNGSKQAVEESVAVPPQPCTHNLYLKRKFNLSGCAAKAAVYLDGEQCALLGAHGEACVPIRACTHEIFVRIASGVGLTDLGRLTFEVTDHDMYGLLYVKQTAFSGEWVFELRESF